jgi:hypothetical protein
MAVESRHLLLDLAGDLGLLPVLVDARRLPLFFFETPRTHKQTIGVPRLESPAGVKVRCGAGR